MSYLTRYLFSFEKGVDPNQLASEDSNFFLLNVIFIGFWKQSRSRSAGLFLSSSDFSQNQHFRKILLGIRSECQTIWIHIRPDILSGLIWFQTVCKVYRQTTLVGKELNVGSWSGSSLNVNPWCIRWQFVTYWRWCLRIASQDSPNTWKREGRFLLLKFVFFISKSRN